MPRSVTLELTNPLEFQAAIKPGEGDILVTAKGRFRVALTQVDLDRLWLQYAEEELPRVSYFAQSSGRTAIALLADDNQANGQGAGIDIGPSEILVTPAGA